MRVVSEAQLAAALSAVAGVPRVVVSGNFATPHRAVGVLDRAVAEYRLFALNAQPGVPDRAGVVLETPFVGPGMRGRPGLRYFPSRLSLVPHLLKQTLPPDIVVVHTSTPADGTVSLGTEVNILPAAIEAVRSRGGLVVAQLNPRTPYTHGDAVLACDEIDYAVEADEPLASPSPRVATDDTFRAIGARVADLVPDAATLQLGIGAVPDAVLAALTGRRGIGVWSEMFSDGVLGLERTGALDGDTPVTASFVFGSAELYAWVDRNPRIRLLRTEKTNDPALIAKHPRLISVNSALQVDLYAQANANQVRGSIYSGFGVLDVALPLSGKAAEGGFAVLPRGSRAPVTGEVLRFFAYWRQAGRRTDYDLSVLLLDERFRPAGRVSWTNHHHGGVTFSGDLTEAADGATEFVDVPLDMTAYHVVPTVHIYSGESFDEVAESMFGYQTRERDQRGAPFDARTVRARSELRGDGRVALPMVFARGEHGWQAVWLHLYLRGWPAFNRVEENAVTTAEQVRALVERRYLTVSYLLDRLRARTEVTVWDGQAPDGPVTFVGLDAPGDLPDGSAVYTLDRLGELLPV